MNYRFVGEAWDGDREISVETVAKLLSANGHEKIAAILGDINDARLLGSLADSPPLRDLILLFDPNRTYRILTPRKSLGLAPILERWVGQLEIDLAPEVYEFISFLKESVRQNRKVEVG